MQADARSLIIYWGTLLITLLLSFFYENYEFSSRIGKIFFRIIVVLPFSLLAGVRDHVGVDYKHYIVIFSELSHLSVKRALANLRYERGFILLIKLAQLIINERWFCFFVLEFVTLMVAMVGFERMRKKVSITLMLCMYYLFVYHLSLNIMRQVLAMSFVIISITYIMENQLVKATGVLLLATQFHDSVVICFTFVMIPLLYNFKVFNVAKLKAERKEHNDEFFLFRIGLKRVLFYSVVFISTIMIGKLIQIGIAVGIISSYYAHYFRGSSSGIGNLVYAFIFLGPATILCGETIEDNFDLCVLRDIVFLYLPISYVGYYAGWASRLIVYPELALLIFAPLLCAREKIWERRQVIGILYTMMIMYNYIASFLIANTNDTFPYHFIFE